MIALLLAKVKCYHFRIIFAGKSLGRMEVKTFANPNVIKFLKCLCNALKMAVNILLIIV